MKIAIFSSKPCDRQSLERYNAPFDHELMFYKLRLSPETVPLGRGFPDICVFVHDVCNAEIITDLATHSRSHAGKFR